MKPLYRPLYNLSQNKLAKILYYLNNILAKDQIYRSNLLARVSILFISKKNSGLRFYIDCRDLLIVIVKNYYLLSLFTEILDYLYRFKVFIKLDVKNIYYRIRVRQVYKQNTIFYIYYNYFKCLVISFKLTNTLVIFQIYINQVLVSLEVIIYIIYLDYILI